jgi:hypothetical protein
MLKLIYFQFEGIFNDHNVYHCLLDQLFLEILILNTHLSHFKSRYPNATISLDLKKKKKLTLVSTSQDNLKIDNFRLLSAD